MTLQGTSSKGQQLQVPADAPRAARCYQLSAKQPSHGLPGMRAVMLSGLRTKKETRSGSTFHDMPHPAAVSLTETAPAPDHAAPTHWPSPHASLHNTAPLWSLQVGYLAQHPLFEQIPALAGDIREPQYCALGEGDVRSVNAWFGPPGTVSCPSGS